MFGRAERAHPALCVFLVACIQRIIVPRPNTREQQLRPLMPISQGPCPDPSIISDIAIDTRPGSTCIKPYGEHTTESGLRGRWRMPSVRGEGPLSPDSGHKSRRKPLANCHSTLEDNHLSPSLLNTHYPNTYLCCHRKWTTDPNPPPTCCSPIPRLALSLSSRPSRSRSQSLSSLGTAHCPRSESSTGT